MGFIIGLIVNGILLSIPIGATLGTLFGIRPFENEREPILQDLNQIVITSLCDEFHEFAQNKNGFNYTCELWDMISSSIWLGKAGIIMPLLCLHLIQC
jgi:hypothetical protein